MTATDERVMKLINKAAKSAMFSWRQSDEGVEDLVGDLWVWYLERPGTRKQIEEADDALAKTWVYKAALQILASNALSSDVFRGVGLYSSESVRDELKGESSNKSLQRFMPLALKELEKQNKGQYEAIQRRYVDLVVPERGSSNEAKLKRAVKSLTERINMIKIEGGGGLDDSKHHGPKIRSSGLIDPEFVSSSGDYSDPTANIAIMLILNPFDEDGNPVRDEYLHEDPITEWTGPRR